MLSITEMEIQAKIGEKIKNVENDFLTEMYGRDPPLSKTVDSHIIIMLHFHPLPAKNSRW